MAVLSPNWGDKLIYLLRESWRGVCRGAWMNWAAISTLTLMLFLLGASYLAGNQIQQLLDQMGSILEVTAYLKPEVDTQGLQAQISSWTGVDAVRVLSKELAWQKLLVDLGQAAGEAEVLLGENPLLDALKISTLNTESIPLLAQQLSALKEVESVWFVQDLVRQLEQIRQSLGNLSIVVVGVFSGIALTVTRTTIQLVILARSEEIEVMELVGASPRWIYFPFLLQGAGLGLVATILAGLLLWFMGLLVGQVLFPLGISQGVSSIGITPWLMLGCGSGLGVLASWLSVRQVSR